MRIASYKTIKNNRKTRRAYAVEAVNREIFSDDLSSAGKASDALELLRESLMSKDEMTDWANLERDYRLTVY